MSCMFGVIVQVVCRTSTGGAAGTGNIWIVGCNGAGIDTIAVKGGRGPMHKVPAGGPRGGAGIIGLALVGEHDSEAKRALQ